MRFRFTGHAPISVDMGRNETLKIWLGTLYDGARRAVSWPSIVAFCCHSTGVHLISGGLIADLC